MEITNLNLLSVSIFIFIVIIIFYMAFKGYKKQIKININFKNLATRKYFFVKYVFLILAFFTIFISIFGIKSGISNYDKKEGIDIVFVLDVSKSMNVADIGGSQNFTRLDFAKQSISEYVSNNLNNRYGLVIFSGDAVASSPITSDLNLFLSILNNVDYRNLVSQGTNFNKAFELGFDRFNFTTDKAGALILISDGGEGQDTIDKTFLSKLKTDKVQVLIGGVGTEKGGKIITGVDVFGRVSYQTYMGDYVISKFNPSNLELLSSIFNSKFEVLTSSSDIRKFENSISKIQTKVIENNHSGSKLDFSRSLTFISFIFFSLYLICYIFEVRLYYFKK
ncbi:MAG: VWA domain-containing protein [Candidatus Gracilibacteria bacterium]|nr:VWA domain-containing protein [Candidatus Gracilibacteria bacterium]